MSRPEITGRAISPSIAPDAYTIPEFCVAHRISESFYYKLKAQGLTPDELALGSRVIITKESAARWRAARTAESTV